jgi:hypothetical protein
MLLNMLYFALLSFSESGSRGFRVFDFYFPQLFFSPATLCLASSTSSSQSIERITTSSLRPQDRKKCRFSRNLKTLSFSKQWMHRSLLSGTRREK